VIALLIVLYTGFVLVLFKVLHLRPTPYLIATLIVAGIVMVGGVVVAWMQSAPISDKLVTNQYVVQLVPYVKGQVKEVYAQANRPLNKGDLLLQIDPEPYQYDADQLEAQIDVAKTNVLEAQAAAEAADENVTKAKDQVAETQAAVEQAKAGVADAEATLAKAKAADLLARTSERMEVDLQRAAAGAVSKLKVDRATQLRQEADAAVAEADAGTKEAYAGEQHSMSDLAAARSAASQAQAAAQQAKYAVMVARTSVRVVQAQLDNARFNLAQSKMTAPADGYLVNWQVQVGTMLAPSAAAGTFVNTSSIQVFALFPQNYLTNVRQHDDAELVLDRYPGRLFTGKVDVVIPATGGGQLAPGGNIPTDAQSTGAAAVQIVLDDPAVARKLSIGLGGTAAIYTGVGKPTHIISKVTMRMKKWLLYVVPSVSSGA
jgi:membrane fusion protein (multidrug efflux system)